MGKRNGYCMYLRKSRKDVEAEARGEGETLAMHEAILLDLAKKLNIVVAKVYKEIVSGETIAARPMMQELLHDVSAERWDGVLVVEVERLARGDTADQGAVSNAFRDSATKIITPIKTYDPTDEYDEEYFEFGLFMSRREYKIINRRLKRGKVSAVEEGRWIGSTPPYGYIRVKRTDGKGYTLEAKNPECEAVQLVFDRYSKLVQPCDIIEELELLSYPPPALGRWDYAAITRMLQTLTYTGFIVHGKKTKKKKVVDGQLVTAYESPDDYMIRKALWAPLVSMELYKKCQKIRESRHTAKRNKANDRPLQNPLAGLIRCGKCGHIMQRTTYSKSQARITCKQSDCSGSAILSSLEEDIIYGLGQWLHDYELTVEKEAAIEDTKLETVRQAVKRALAEKETIRKQIPKLHDLLEQGVYDVDTFIERSAALSEKLRIAEDKIQRLNKELEASSRGIDYETVVPAIKTILDIYWTLSDASDKNKLLKSAINEIIFHPESSPSRRVKAYSLEIKPLLK